MKKQKQSILMRILKFIWYSFIVIVFIIVLLLFSQTTESKSLSIYDYAIIIGGLLIIYLVSQIEDLSNKIDELESRLDDIQNQEEDYFEEYK